MVKSLRIKWCIPILTLALAAIEMGAGPVRSIPGLQLFYPAVKVDYGSGASIKTEWYSAGGLPGIGVFAGHPNGMARGDRALVRFNLSPLFLKPGEAIADQAAILRFKVSYVAGKAETRKIEIVHLEYDPWNLTGTDLVNAKVHVVGTVTVGRKGSSDRVYSVNVTKWVREGLLRGDKYCGFRFRDAGAEARGNPDLAATGVAILFNATTPALEMKEMK